MFRLPGGQYEFSSFLKPGEKVITPSVTLIKFNGNDKCRQINMWRRWFYDCAAIRNSDGELFGSRISYGPSMSVTPDQTESNMIAQLKNYNASYRNTLYWIDAGWYPIYGNLSLPITNTYWRYTGTWRVDTNRFPTKFAEVKKNFADGVKLMLWFEPERVVAGTELSEMPELLLTGGDGINSLLNMGDPAAVRLISEKVVGIMKETGCDIYRQDFNIDPYEFWKSADLRQGSNRNGMTENLYVQGLADYYITLLRYTDNPIDMCASGGMRNDMSVMRFSINMTVSDTSAEKLTIHQNIRLCYNEWFSADVYIDRESCSSAREMQSVRRWICPASGKYELVFSCAPENEAASCCAVLSINCGNVPEVIKQFCSSDTDNSFCGDVILSGNDAVDVSVTGNGAFRINVTVRKLRG